MQKINRQIITIVIEYNHKREQQIPPKRRETMKYTYKDLMEHIEEEERDFTIIKIDGNVISVSRDCSFGGSSCGRYFSARLNGKIVCTRCARDIGIRKALAVLNK